MCICFSPGPTVIQIEIPDSPSSKNTETSSDPSDPTISSFSSSSSSSDPTSSSLGSGFSDVSSSAFNPSTFSDPFKSVEKFNVETNTDPNNNKDCCNYQDMKILTIPHQQRPGSNTVIGGEIFGK